MAKAKKTPLILLPGLLCDAALWGHQTETLADVADATVADLTRDDTIAAMAARVLKAAPGKFALAGLSMGGYVAQEIMRQAPARVTRLALIDTSSRADDEAQRSRRYALLSQLEHGDFKGVTTRLLPLLIHRDRLADEALVGVVRASAAHVGRDAYRRQQHAILGRPDGRADLRKIACPTLVMCGRQDALTPLPLHEEMAAEIPRASLVVVEDCGHLAPLERPRTVTAVLRYWLDRGD
ncbi:MAG: alpha/beta fold hydrolase [Rhodospirillales bacterium]